MKQSTQYREPISYKESLYMIIEKTPPEKANIILVATGKRAALIGRLLKSQGRDVIAPPVTAAGLESIPIPTLIHLYWNTCKEEPPEPLPLLISTILETISKLPLDETSITSLQKQVDKLTVDSNLRSIPQTQSIDLLQSDTLSSEIGQTLIQPKPQHPKANGACGAVWDIAEKMFKDNNNQIPDRKLVIEACSKSSISESTASTQFWKWKTAKLAAPTPRQPERRQA